KNFDSYQLNALLSQTENFQSRTPGDTVLLRSLPTVEFNSVERPLGRGWPFWFSWDSSIASVSRKEPVAPMASGLKTGFLDRLDFHPRLTLPLHWKALQLTPVLGF